MYRTEIQEKLAAYAEAYQQYHSIGRQLPDDATSDEHQAHRVARIQLYDRMRAIEDWFYKECP